MFFLSQADFFKILEKKQGIHFLVLFLEQIHSMQFFYYKKKSEWSMVSEICSIYIKILYLIARCPPYISSAL